MKARHWRWLLLFGLLVAAYGWWQNWEQQRSANFQAVLLDFLPQQVGEISISEGGGAPFRLLRQQGRWLYSQESTNESANATAIKELMQQLQHLRTDRIVANKQSDWHSFGLTDQQATQVCLKRADKQDCLYFGGLDYNEERQERQTFVRVATRPEVYTLRVSGGTLIDFSPVRFRRNTLLSLPEIPLNIQLISATDTITVLNNQGNWYCGGQLLDSIYWSGWSLRSQHLQSNQFADDINELEMDSLRQWKVLIFTAQQEVQVDCYADPSQGESFIFTSSQYAKTWLRSDSSGLYQHFKPLLKLVATESD